MKAALRDVLRHPGIWRSSQDRGLHRESIPSGFSTLDAKLPGDGWPLGTLTEILYEGPGIGELRLVMPALAHLSRQGRWLVWISPPHIPYAPALADHGVDLSRVMLIETGSPAQSAWAAEQALSTRDTGAVLSWSSALNDRALRRLQLAAEAGGSWGLLFGLAERARQSSAAALRVQLRSSAEGVVVHVLKCRGGPTGRNGIKIGFSDLNPTSRESSDPPLLDDNRARRTRGGA